MMNSIIPIWPTRWPGTPARLWLPTLAALLAMHFGGTAVRAGTLYASNLDANTIQSFDTTANPPTPRTFASTWLDHPYALAFDAAGNLYAANALSNTIERFTPGGVGSVFASTGLNEPFGLAFDSSGNLYVGNIGTGILGQNFIERFAPGGAGRVFAAGLDSPIGLAFSAVPEPSSAVLAASGLVLALGYVGYRRRTTARTDS
jgi:hypothetical protein